MSIKIVNLFYVKSYSTTASMTTLKNLIITSKKPLIRKTIAPAPTTRQRVKYFLTEKLADTKK